VRRTVGTTGISIAFVLRASVSSLSHWRLTKDCADLLRQNREMPARERFDWQEAAGHVSVKVPVTGWAALEGSGGRRRDPANERTVQPWPYPLRGVLVEFLVDQEGVAGPDSPREFFVAIDVAGVRTYVLRDDPNVLIHRHSMRTG
jgi:hypothetical protein